MQFGRNLQVQQRLRDLRCRRCIFVGNILELSGATNVSEKEATKSHHFVLVFLLIFSGSIYIYLYQKLEGYVIKHHYRKGSYWSRANIISSYEARRRPND